MIHNPIQHVHIQVVTCTGGLNKNQLLLAYFHNIFCLIRNIPSCMKDRSNSGIESASWDILDHHSVLYISTELKHLRGTGIGIENRNGVPSDL